MKFVALVSGGKDSIYSILECLRLGHILLGCVHLGAPIPNERDGEKEVEVEVEESYMYQTAASETLQVLIEECLQVPLVVFPRRGKSIQTSLIYDTNDNEQDNATNTAATSSHDEVEDLYWALQQAQGRFPDVQAVSSGAILSTYQRVRVEHVCSRLGLTSLSYLWRVAPQHELLPKMLQDGIVAVIVRAACPPGLLPRKHLNVTLNELWNRGLLQRWHRQYQFHICGEGGEYETLVLDSPLHRKKLVLDQVEIVETDDGVGFLKIISCHAEEKGEHDVHLFQHLPTSSQSEPYFSNQTKSSLTSNMCTPEASRIEISPTTPSVAFLPAVCQGAGGLLHVSEVMAPAAASSGREGSIQESHLALAEAMQVFSILRKVLARYSATPEDVVMVHLYLSEITLFAAINTQYRHYFGTVLPPSRSCVAVGRNALPGGRRILLDCMIQCGSGEYMRRRSDSPGSDVAWKSPYARVAHATKTSLLRHVLHVQSISHWAPVCVGPYSQVNTIRSGLHWLAGQIGLVPKTMTLQTGGWTCQLQQCWTNIASVLDALDGGSLQHLLSGLIYVAHQEVYRKLQPQTVVREIESISRMQVMENGGIVPGRIDSVAQDRLSPYDGYEDEGTMLALKKDIDEQKFISECPLLVVVVSEMPVGASIEVEVVAVTKQAASCLELTSSFLTLPAIEAQAEFAPPLDWDTGHDFSNASEANQADIHLHAAAQILGNGCAANAVLAASVDSAAETLDIRLEVLLRDMLSSLDKVLAEGRSGLCATYSLSVRLYYIATAKESHDDGLQVRSALQSALAAWRGADHQTPASTVIPVQAIHLLHTKPISAARSVFLAMQVLVVNPIHLETEIWIHHGR